MKDINNLAEDNTALKLEYYIHIQLFINTFISHSNIITNYLLFYINLMSNKHKVFSTKQDGHLLAI